MINLCKSFNPKDCPSFEAICTKLKKDFYKLLDVSKSEKHENNAMIDIFKQKIPAYISIIYVKFLLIKLKFLTFDIVVLFKSIFLTFISEILSKA